MSLYLFNSLSRKKELFKPLKKNHASLYVCGITPDNFTHLGHAFTYVSFDVLVRHLKYKGYTVNYLQNATDINDSNDVISQAKKDGKTWEEEADYWIKHFLEQMDRLNVQRPDKYILATSVIPQIIEINRTLVKKGFAYVKNGNVYFDISKFKKYGQLSKYSNEQMLFLSKERGNNPNDKNKKNPLDFVLWKSIRQKPYWDSPWGSGRPGWHIECSTMINLTLGSQIDIHGGGRDLIYPHHESEIAQSESATSKSPFVSIWIHTSMVIYEGEKMSKSLGNLVTVESLLKKYSPAAIRYMLLLHHYREPWEYEEYDLEQIERKVKNIQASISKIKSSKNKIDKKMTEQFENYMNDDLNTPRALELVDKLINMKKIEEVKFILKTLGINL